MLVPSALSPAAAASPAASAQPTAPTVTVMRDLLAGSADDMEKVLRVHRHLTQRLTYGTDIQLWGMEDYWASPHELSNKGAGDGEDLALAQYVILLDAGVPAERLRLVYVQATVANGQANPDLVLAYFPGRLDQDPLILDSRREAPASASQRRDLSPLFMFAIEGPVTDLPARAPANRGTTPLWMENREAFVRKALAEGFRLPVSVSR